MNIHVFRIVVLGSLALIVSVVSLTETRGQDRSRDAKRLSKSREFLSQLDRDQNGSLEPNEIPEFARRTIARLAEKRGLDPNQPLSIEKLDAEPTNEAEKKDSSKAPSSGTAPVVPTFDTKTNTAPAPGFDTPLTTSLVASEELYDKKVRDQVYKEVLPKYDRNHDGILEIGEETKDGKWSPELTDSDTNKDGRLDKAELFERYAKKFNLPRRDPNVAAGASLATGAAPAATKSEEAAAAEKVREYAKGLLTRYDKNKNGMLERDEWQEMKSDYHAADVNRDGVITLDELTVKLSGFASSSNPTTTGSTPVSSHASSTSTKPGSSSRKWWQNSSSTSSTNKTPEKKTYRFLTPVERLPKGLPDWFARSDTNSDGQVMMSEYAAAWTDSLVAEFQKYDRDADGIITPEECLAVEKEKKK